MRKTITALVMTAMVLGTVSGAQAGGSGSDDADHRQGDHETAHEASQMTRLIQATARDRRISHALADGYQAFTIPPDVGGTPTTGLGLVGDPTCFDSTSGGMGVHYVKGIDGDVNVSEPEALVYEVNKHGRLKLVAVEYIVPDGLVDPANPPMLFGQHFHHHGYLPVYVLHVWAWKYNPSGMFADWNPRVNPCPDPKHLS